MRIIGKAFRAVCLAGFLGLILTACTQQPERLWLKSPGWSRAKLIGNTRVGDSVPMVIDRDGNIFVFFVNAENDNSHLRVIAFDSKLDVLWDRTYEEIELETPAMPRILEIGETFQLFWIGATTLYSAQISVDGKILAYPTSLSGNDLVEYYDVAVNSSDQISVWYAGDRDEPGLYTLPLGNLDGEAILVDEIGINPDLIFDENGTLHVIWASFPPGTGDKPFLYAAYPAGEFIPGHESVVVTPRIVGTTVMEGPKIGLGGKDAYVLWTMIFFSGEEAGTTETSYISFTAGRPTYASIGSIFRAPYSYDLPYQPYPGNPLIAGSRISIDSGRYGQSFYVTQVEPNASVEDELVVTMQPWMGYLMRKTKPQVTLAFFQDGVPASYQILSFTPANSTYPAIFSDSKGYLYSTWLEKGDLPAWGVYVSSTSPDIIEPLSKLTSNDVGILSADALFGFLTGALLIPIGLAWILPSMLVLALSTRILRVQESLVSTGSIISAGLAFIVLWIVKLGVLPGMTSYVPFSAWIPILPEWLSLPLRIGTPLIIAVIALLLARFILKRREETSLFAFFLIYGAIDAVFTLGMYGVLIFAAF